MNSLFVRATENKEKVVLFYIDKNNKVTQRYVKVLKAEGEYIQGYCYYRKKYRTFKIDQILSADRVRSGGRV